MRNVLASTLLFLVACSTTTPSPRTQRAAAPPSLVASGTAQRVVLLSFDGLGADALAARSGLPSFEALARDGAVARIIPVNPTVTSSTHVSILTGALPDRHGIVANRFHVPGTSPEVTARGMDTPISVETLLMAARRQGKRVGAVTFPSIDASTPERTADFGIVWRPSLTAAKVITLTRADFRREWVPPTWTQRPQRRTSYSPIMRARIEWVLPKSARADVDVVAYDTTNDATENYDTYRVEVQDRELDLDARNWFAVSQETSSGLAGSWSKILSSGPALDVKVYWGAISRTVAYPDAYRDMLDREVGFWPGSPDEMSDIDESVFADQIDRVADYFTRAQTLTIRTMPFDLLLAYQPQIDTAQHNFLGYDDSIIDRAMVLSDRAVQSIRAALDPARDALVVTGDHGVVPVDQDIHLNRFLVERGFGPRWRAYTSGNVAQLYRFGGPDDADALLQALQATGWFEALSRKSATSHPNTGDLVAVSFPRFGLSASAEPPVLAEPGNYGQHGALNTYRSLHTVLFAAGAGVPRGSFGEISQTKIARFVSSLLGIQPPAAAE